MTDIMDNVEDALDTARDAAGDFLNIGERNAGHVALGVAVTVGFALAVQKPEQCAPDHFWQWLVLVVIAALVFSLATREAE